MDKDIGRIIRYPPMADRQRIPYNDGAGAENQAVGGVADEPSLTPCDSAEIDGARPQPLYIFTIAHLDI